MNPTDRGPAGAGEQAAGRESEHGTTILYPEFNLIDTAFGGVNKRNKLIRLEQLRIYAKKHMKQNDQTLRDCYRTYFRYPKAMLEHFKIEIRDTRGDIVKKRNSVEKYTGAHYSDCLPVDFDLGKDDDKDALVKPLQSTKNFLLSLESQYEVDLNTIRIFFSGYKGFHVEISSRAFGFDPSPRLNEMFRYIVRKMGVSFDPSVYDNVRLWRLPGSINSKSGLHKIPLTVDELFNLTIPEIKELAKAPRKVAVEDNIALNPELHRLYIEAKETVSQPESKTGKKEKRERAYEKFFSQDTIKEREGRNNALLSYGSRLRAMGIALDEIAMILSGINSTRFAPPLDAGEFENVLKSVARYENENNHFEFKTTSWLELMGKEEPEIEFLIEDLLPCACLLILAGKPKLGKSLLALLCAISVGLGRSLWNKKVNKGGILFISTEDGLIRLKKRVWKMTGDPDKHTPDFHFYVGDCILTRKGVFDAFQAKVIELKPRLVVLDPLINLFRGGKLDSAEDMNAVLRPLQTLAKETGSCILVVHHARKSSGEDPIDIIQGSVTISGVADGLLIMHSFKTEGGAKRATLDVILKDAEVPQKVVLKLEENLCWNVEGSLEEIISRNLSDDLEKTLRDEPSGMTIAALMQLLQVDYFRLYRLLQKWEGEGKVSCKQVGRAHTKVYSWQCESKTNLQTENKGVTNGNSSQNSNVDFSFCTGNTQQSEGEKSENLQNEDAPPEYME